MNLLSVIAASKRREFNPLSLSPLAWFDAADAATLLGSGGTPVADNGAIYTWKDKSTNERHATQSVANTYPLRKTGIQNSFDAVYFDGSNDYLKLPRITGGFASGFSVVAVIKPVDGRPAIAKMAYGALTSNTGVDSYWYFYLQTNGVLLSRLYSNGSIYGGTMVTLADGAVDAQLFSTRCTPGTSIVGCCNASAAFTSSLSGVDYNRIADAETETMYLGARNVNGASSEPLNCYFCEFLLFGCPFLTPTTQRSKTISKQNGRPLEIMQNLIDIPILQQRPPAETLALHLLTNLNSEIARRVQCHQSSYRAFWDSEVPPDDILTAMDTGAIIMLGSASESVDHIARLAAMVGKQLTDFLPADQWVPRREFVIVLDADNQPTGRVTLEPPPVGYDAWGRPLPVVIPDPEPEPEPEV